MPLSLISAVCPSCKHCFSAIPTRSFLGFQKLACPACKNTVLYPLTSGYRIAYAVLLAYMAFMIFKAFSQGGFGFPGGVGIAVVIALLRDWRIRANTNTLIGSADGAPAMAIPSLPLPSQLTDLKARVKSKAKTGLTVSLEDGRTILAVASDSSAQVAGVQVGDQLVAVDGELCGQDYKANVVRIMGDPGTSVRITVWRQEATHSFNLVRE